MVDLPLPPRTRIEAIIEKAHLQEYNKDMNFFYFELSSLHINVYLIEKITLSFPHELFLDSYERAIFLSCFVNNTLDMAILIITRLLDAHGDTFTIDKFSKRVQELVKPEYKKAFKEYLKPYKLVRWLEATGQIEEVEQRCKTNFSATDTERD